ncbi:hypothetical protein Tco_1401494 [Tanacetum coccineum]
MLEFEAYKTYHAYATGEKILKPKYVKNKANPESSPNKKSAQDSKGKRLKTSTKVAKPTKKKQPATTLKAKGLNVLYEVALSKAEQVKLATKRSKTQFHSSHASGSGADEGTDGQDDDNEQTESDNDSDEFVHPKFSTHDEEERHDEEDKEEEGSDLRVQTPSHFESTDDEAYDEVTQGVNVKGEDVDEDEANEEEEVNKLYRDVNVNLEGRDTEMTDAPQTNVQGTQVTEDTHVIITSTTPEVQQQSSSVSSGFISNMLNPNPDTCIDSILNMNTESTSLVDVPVTTNVEMPPSSVTTLPPPPIPHIQPQQQTPVSTPIIAPIVSSILGIVDQYLANKMNEAVKTAMQLQSDRLRDEAQAENKDFINTLDENIRKIIKRKVKEQVKEQVSKILSKIEKLVNDQLEAEVLIRSSNEAKTSHAVAANLSELELKKILIDKMENNKSIDRSIQQKNLYKALVDAYETDKDILETYRDTVTFKRRRDDEDEDKEPSARSNRGSKRRRAGKEPESTSAPKEKTSMSSGKSKEGSKSHQKSTGKSAQAEEPIHADEDLEEPAHQEFDTGFTEDQPVDETTQHPDWFQKPTKPPTPDRDWNKTLSAKHGPGISYWGRKRQQFYGYAVNRESARDVYSRHRILAVIKLKIVEWHNYKHLDWITVHRYDDKLYTFKEGDYNILHLQDIEDMLLLLVQGKLTNLNIEIRFKSYQKKLNLTRPDTYRSDLKRKTPYTAYSNPKGFIYQNKDKKNRLMRIDELRKFSDVTLNDVRSALDDILKRIRMEYLPQTFWRNVGRERAGAMI